MLGLSYCPGENRDGSVRFSVSGLENPKSPSCELEKKLSIFACV